MQEPAANTAVVAGHRLRVALNGGCEIVALANWLPGLPQTTAARCANRRRMDRGGGAPGPTRKPPSPEVRVPPERRVAPPAH